MTPTLRHRHPQGRDAAHGFADPALCRGHRVPAGNSLAVDRDAFSARVTADPQDHPRISSGYKRQVTAPDLSRPDHHRHRAPDRGSPRRLALRRHRERAARTSTTPSPPSSTADSVDMDIAWMAARYDKGGRRLHQLPPRQGASTTLSWMPFSRRSACRRTRWTRRYFEACLPIEVMAERGPETLRHGPMKPVGLDDPRTGRWPHAVVQLRQDTLAGRPLTTSSGSRPGSTGGEQKRSLPPHSGPGAGRVRPPRQHPPQYLRSGSLGA